MPSTPSDPEALRRSLGDIQHHIAMAEGFVAGMAYTTFKDDNLHLYAVVRCLEIISEASRSLPDALKHAILRLNGVIWQEPATSIAMNMKMSLPVECGVRSSPAYLC
jgi:uncharacterized protein with HEPN domain